MNELQRLPSLLKELRLTAMTKAWPTLNQKAISEAWEPSAFLSQLCELELDHRYETR